MIKITINDKRYKLKTSWSKITAGEAIALDELPIPDKLLNILKQDDEDKRNKLILALTEDDAEQFNTYYREVIKLLSDIPADIVDDLYSGYIDSLFLEMFYKLIFEIKTLRPENNAELISEFEWMKFKHLYVDGDVIPAHDTTAGTFTEAADLMTNVKGVVMGCATYLTKGDDKILKKYEKLKRKRMTKIWELFFYIRLSSLSSTELMRDYSLEAEIEDLNQLEQGRQSMKLQVQALRERSTAF